VNFLPSVCVYGMQGGIHHEQTAIPREPLALAA
jgi:hypothetical protein